MMHNTGIKSGSTETATGALSVTGPQPVWMTLDEARERSFTGEVVFEVDPEVLAYLDNGVVYYAERTSDAPLGRRLLDAGVVDTGQLERGTVRVGDVEHLGRLFDRDPSVDRDAVLVVTETATEDLIAELANSAVATIRVTAYRHHPSGLHRWFVAQLDAPEAAGPLASVTPIDSNAVIDDQPGFAVGVDELTIEWDEFDDGPMEVATLPEVEEFELVMFDPFREEQGDDGGSPVAVEYDDDRGEADAEAGPAVEDDLDEGGAETAVLIEEPGPVEVVPIDDDVADFDFLVTWPDGSERSIVADPAEFDDGPDEADGTSAFVETDQGELRFEMPPLESGGDDEASDEVPDDVAAAVRRAIAAIETAAAPPVQPASEITTQMPVVEAEPAPTAFTGFAPPTLDMSAEAIYARMEESAMLEVAPEAVSGEAPALPSPGVASVVFVDEEPEPEPADERSSALRRLIGSLRRKDH
jgi:hypothetical protein